MRKYYVKPIFNNVTLNTDNIMDCTSSALVSTSMTMASGFKVNTSTIYVVNFTEGRNGYLEPNHKTITGVDTNKMYRLVGAQPQGTNIGKSMGGTENWGWYECAGGAGGTAGNCEYNYAGSVCLEEWDATNKKWIASDDFGTNFYCPSTN